MQRENFAAHYPASLYDLYSERFLGVYDDWVIRRLRQLFRNTPSDGILLDIGTGTARLLCKLALQDTFSQLKLIGVDYFHDMVSIAKQNVEKSRLGDRIAIEQADAHDLPFESGAVRYILSRSTIHHWSDPVKALEEIYRVLEPQGAALIYEISRTANADAIARFNELRRMANVEASRMEEKYTPEELWEFVKSAGLETKAELLAPKMGLMSLGIELKIIKR